MSLEHLQPLYDKIIVRRHREKTHVAIEGVDKSMEIPESAREKQHRGVILKVGAGRPGANGIQKLLLKPGMEVLFQRHSGLPLDEDEDPDVIVMREDEVMAYGEPGHELRVVNA